MRISLHRPYILRRLGSDRYQRSRRACFTAALMDFEVRQSFRRTQSKEILHMVGNAYRELQTAMISGIYLILEPTDKDADAMHRILDNLLLNLRQSRNLQHARSASESAVTPGTPQQSFLPLTTKGIISGASTPGQLFGAPGTPTNGVPDCLIHPPTSASKPKSREM